MESCVYVDGECTKCGYRPRRGTPYRQCSGPPSSPGAPAPPEYYGRPPLYFMWGDMVKTVLSSLAITEERYVAFSRLVTGMKGIPQKKGCGCAARRERLNDSGYLAWRYLHRLRRRISRKITG